MIDLSAAKLLTRTHAAIVSGTAVTGAEDARKYWLLAATKRRDI